MKYSILTYNFNEYEKFYEIENPDSEVEYLYITDNENLISNTWKIIVDHDLDGMRPFDKTFAVRYNVWKYCTTDICIRLDGSFRVHGSFDKLIDKFNSEIYDAAIVIHPCTNNIVEEYNRWIEQRSYNPYQAEKCLNYMKHCGFDTDNNSGLLQQNFVIQRKNDINNNIDKHVFNTLKELGENDKIERLDQTITSFILQHFYKNINLLYLSEITVLDTEYCTWYLHNSNQKIVNIQRGVKYTNTGYFFNKEIQLY